VLATWLLRVIQKYDPFDIEKVKETVDVIRHVRLPKTQSSLLADLDVDPQIRADKMGHAVDVNQNVYTKRSLGPAS
jgi:hypothetical protein